MKVVRFTKDHSPYMAGEVASFSDEDADVRIRAGVAELVKEYKVQPDQRTETKVDEDGHTYLETRTVPDDLQRNVDLPPTEAGGKPKAEENMTEEEKKRVAEYEETGVDPANTRSVEAPIKNKMVEKPQAKK